MDEQADVPAREVVFRLSDLPEVREFAAGHARAAGLPDEEVSDLLVAVNEVATNAVTHGVAGKARLRVWSEPDAVVVEVHDDGRWELQGDPGNTPPPPDATSGMGLWVARRLAQWIGFRTGREGSTVTMRFRGRRAR
ncbi:ATP-binding protein [Nonomuraea sp. NPDC049152]|uniref:ATP-binding protein n=1 Tax=Nonomuraea sp. NPDC049152 TaxID=3154350 RepID=UPI0033F4A501